MKLFTFCNLGFVLLLAMCMFSYAQQSDLLQFPPGLLIPNYNRIPVGQNEAAEGGAFVARSSGLAANWYNPAGLALAESLSLNAGSSGYELIKLKLDGFQNTPRSLSTNGTPGFIGIVTKPPFKTSKRVRLGFSFGQQSSWQPNFDSNTKLNGVSKSDQLSIAYKLKFSTAAPALAFGVISNPRFRWGFGIQVPFTTLNIYESIGVQVLDSSHVLSNLINLRVNGLEIQMVGIGGVQGTLTDKIVVGGFIKSPTLRVWDNAQISYESIESGTESSKSIVFHDKNASFNYRFPLQFSFGIAYKLAYYQIEADINYYNGSKPYAVIESNSKITQNSPQLGEAFTTKVLSFPDLEYDRTPVLNAAFGGNFKFSHQFRIHGGLFTDFSPVNKISSTIFRKINLYGATLGLSMSSEKISGGVGFKYSFGRSESFAIGENISPELTDTHLNVDTFTIIWAFSLGL